MFSRFSAYKHRFSRERNLILRLNNELKKLKRYSDDRRKILLESRHILFIIKQLEKADVYWFIKEDIIKIKNYLKKVRKNPKNKNLIYILASVYIVAPGTFEATGIILFFRYVWRLFGRYFLKR
jgi:hypothetical protein